MTYDAYGNTTETTGTATTPLGYDGQYTSTDTKLIYLRARTYDPATAQFLSVDPLSNITRSLYGYAHENPLNSADPTGLMANANNSTGLGGSCETRAEHQERLERLRRLKEQVARENAEEQERLEEENSEGRQREHVIERCLGGVAIGSTESWIAKTEVISPVGAITGCASGIYGPILIEGIKSILE